MLPLRKRVKSNCKLCAWHNVQIKTKIFEFEVTCARWLGKECACVNIQTKQILGVKRKAKSVSSSPGCNVFCLKIILVSKRRLLWILHRHLIYQITRTRLCWYADVRNPLWLPRYCAQFTVAFVPALMKRQQRRNVWEFKYYWITLKSQLKTILLFPFPHFLDLILLWKSVSSSEWHQGVDPSIGRFTRTVVDYLNVLAQTEVYIPQDNES